MRLTREQIDTIVETIKTIAGQGALGKPNDPARHGIGASASGAADSIVAIMAT